VSKFFRFSYSRHCDKVVFRNKDDIVVGRTLRVPENDGLNLLTYGLTFVITAMYLVAKAFALGAFMRIHENDMHENVGLWLSFCMLPSFTFALILIFGQTFYDTKNRCCFGCPI
jgi:hypothetical protein